MGVKKNELCLFLLIFTGVISSVECVEQHNDAQMSLKTSEEISLLEPLQFQRVDNVKTKGRDLDQSTDEPPEEMSPENGSSNLVIEPGVGVLESFQQALNNILSSTTPTPTVDVFAPQSLLEQLGIPGPEPVDPTSAPEETVPSKETRSSPRSAVETSVDADEYSTSRMSRPAPSEVPRDNLFQIVGTQFANVLESNSGQQFQNVTSQIAGGITNATNAFTGSSNSGIGTGIQSQLQQLINSIGPSSDSKPTNSQSDSPSPGIAQDSIFQQLGSQVTNPFGINAANGSSITNPLQPVTSQLGTIGNQFAGAIPNATNLIVGTNGADIQSQLQQLINIVGPNRTKPQSDSQPSGVSQDSFFQQLGSQFNNFFSTNNSAVSNPLGSIASQFQNVSSQIAGGITNVSNTFTGSSNSANNTATDPFGVFTSQFQNVGTQITGGITNVTNAFTGSSNTGNSSSFLTSLQNQLLSLLGNTSSTSPPTTNESSTEASSSASTSSPNSESSTDSSTTQPANDPIFPGILQPITIPFGNNGANQSSSSSPFNQIQNIGSQFVTGFSNATSGLLPNTPIGVPNTTAELQNLVNQLSPSSLSQTSNQVVDALKPSSVQGQLQGIGSQLEANIPNVSNDAGILNSLIPNILNWNSVSDLLLPSSLLTSSNNNLNPLPLPFLCPVCTPVCGKANPQARVAGGVELTPSNKYPWTARIMYFGTDVGQGTLINDRAVVTTATIVKSIPIYTAVTVLFNVFDKTATTEQRLERRVANVYTPLLYNPANIYEYNIGIIRLATPVTFSTTFMPICLPKYYDSIGGTSGTLVGWGAQTPTGAGSNKPREVSIPLYTDRECQLSNSRLTSNNLCGGVIKPATDAFIKATCKGDDGAALMYPSRTDATVLTLLGVAIDVPNQGCGETNQLSVFSKVYNNLDFIVLFGSGCGC